MDVIKLLQSQNRCLIKILEKSKQFLALSEPDGHPDFYLKLQEFQNYRDSAIKTISLYDKKISEAIQKLPQSLKTQSLIEAAQKTQETKEELLQSILCIDQRIIDIIEMERVRLLKELSASTKNNEIVRKFKSTWIPEAGETLDGKL